MTKHDEDIDTTIIVDCCNSDCNWRGPLSDCSIQPHSTTPVCPICHEVVEAR